MSDGGQPWLARMVGAKGQRIVIETDRYLLSRLLRMPENTSAINVFTYIQAPWMRTFFGEQSVLKFSTKTSNK